MASHRLHDHDAHPAASPPSIRPHRSLPHLSSYQHPAATPPMPRRPPHPRQDSSPLGPRAPGSASPRSAAGTPVSGSSPYADSPRSLLPPSLGRAARPYSPAGSYSGASDGGARERPSTAQDGDPARSAHRLGSEPSSSRRPVATSTASLPVSTPLSEAALKAYSGRFLGSSHGMSSSSSRKSSGNNSESGASVLDMKRLLSKPAPSTRSAPSESSETPVLPTSSPSRGRYASASEHTSTQASPSAATVARRAGSYTAPGPASRVRPLPTLRAEEPSPHRPSASAKKTSERDRKPSSAALKHRSSHSTMRPGPATPTAGSFPGPLTPRRSATAPVATPEPSPRTPDSRLTADRAQDSPVPRSVTPAG
jgi:hypothetical protein